MGQIQGALVGIAMVLSAVFVPMAFFGGTTGAIYRQFSITIVSAMVLSVLVAMILTPALCATLLKPVHKGETHGQRGFFGWFNRTFNRNASRYETAVGKILHRSLRWIMIYVCCWAGWSFCFCICPRHSCPLEAPRHVYHFGAVPSGSTQQQTLKVVQQAEDYFLNNEKQNVEIGVRDHRLRPRRQRPERGAYVRTPEGLGRTRSHNRFIFCHHRTRNPKRLTKLKKRASLPAVRRPSAVWAAPPVSIWSWRITRATDTKR